MAMVDLQLFLVYFWQMESVMVYVCGLPSVDPRVFQSTIIPTICCLLHYVLDRSISPSICQPSLFRIAFPVLVFYFFFFLLSSIPAAFFNRDASLPLLFSQFNLLHLLSFSSTQSQSNCLFFVLGRDFLSLSSCPAFHDVFLTTLTCVKSLDVSTCSVFVSLSRSLVSTHIYAHINHSLQSQQCKKEVHEL